MSVNLSRRLAKLEATHKQILRCAWCRYALKEVSPRQLSQYQATPACVLATKCWHCGTPYMLQLDRADKHYREAANLVYNSHPVKRLTVERIHAAELWLPLSDSEKEEYLKDRQEKAEREAAPRPSPQQAYRPTIRPNAQERKAKAERDDLQARAQVFIQDKQEEFKRRAGRTEPFPIDETLKALDDSRCSSYDKELEAEAEALGLEKHKSGYYDYTAHIATIRNSILKLRKRAACEAVVWGAVLAATLEEIASFEALPPVAAAEALEKQREAKEKAERESAEREAARQARSTTAPESQTALSAADSNFGRSGNETLGNTPSVIHVPPAPDDDGLLRQMMGEAAYNAMMEARKLSHPSTDEQGRKRIEILHIQPESKPPPNDGTLAYQHKLAHWKQTGIWLTNEGIRY